MSGRRINNKKFFIYLPQICYFLAYTKIEDIKDEIINHVVCTTNRGTTACLVTDIINPQENQRFPPIENTFEDYLRLTRFILSYLIDTADNEEENDDDDNLSAIGDTTIALLLHESSPSDPPLINTCLTVTLRSCLATLFSALKSMLLDNNDKLLQQEEQNPIIVNSIEQLYSSSE